MSEFFYNFTLGDENRGYSYLRIDEGHLHSFTRFLLDSGETFTNVFRLRLDGQRVKACKHGDLDWIDLSESPEDHYPGSAYPLLLPKAMTGRYAYTQVSDDDGSVICETVLEREGVDIVERQNGIVCRRFTMDGETPIRIDWGGAVSRLCASAEASIDGSAVDFVVK